jgi:hypothetical protein
VCDHGKAPGRRSTDRDLEAAAGFGLDKSHMRCSMAEHWVCEGRNGPCVEIRNVPVVLVVHDPGVALVRAVVVAVCLPMAALDQVVSVMWRNWKVFADAAAAVAAAAAREVVRPAVFVSLSSLKVGLEGAYLVRLNVSAG